MDVLMPIMEHLEKQYGIALLWEWCKDYAENERECDDGERMGLPEYLMLRAENYDEAET
jgi:hypothetical protein